MGETRESVPGVGDRVCKDLAAGESKPFQKPQWRILCSRLSGEVVSDRPRSSAGPPPQPEVTAAPLNLLPATVLDHVSIVLTLNLVHLL